MKPTAGSYCFIRGTNIEVGIRRSSRSLAHPVAACTFRYGKYRWNRAEKRMYSRENPIRLIVQKIPFACLTPTSDFTNRGYLRASYLKQLEPCPPLRDQPREGVHVTDVRDCYKAMSSYGRKYFVLLKDMTESHFPDLQSGAYYSVFGLRELTFPLRHYDKARQVLTFDTEPVRKAHISVCRAYKSMDHLGGHSQRWESHWRGSSLRGMSDPVDWGYVSGTNMRVHTLLQGPEVSLMKLNQYPGKFEVLSMYVPHVEVTTTQPCFRQEEWEDEGLLKPVRGGALGEGVFVNGLPSRFLAAARERRLDEVEALRWEDVEAERRRFPQAEYADRSVQESMAYVYLVLDSPENRDRDWFEDDTSKWKAYLKHLTATPDPKYHYLTSYGQQERQLYLKDYRQRSNLLNHLRPVAVKV